MLKINDEVKELERGRDKYAEFFPGYITHIRFPRYKNIVDGARVDFSFPVTALVGSNGSGKTSVLNALFGAPARQSTGSYWFSTKVDPIEEGEGSPSRYIYGHRNSAANIVVETRKARVRKFRNGKLDPNYWEPTKELASDGMHEPELKAAKKYLGRSKDRWNPVIRDVLYINFRKELSAFDKYFYFGKTPAAKSVAASKAAASAKKISSRRIISKMDQVRHDAELLSRVIDSGNTSFKFQNRQIATENRLLSKKELDVVSFILGRFYEEARWIRHRLFKGDGGLSVVFKTQHGRYSEAFAGSGEVAVTSCVVQILAAKKGTLVLLDEPEVSLHPGAQERLLAFLLKMSRTRQLQVVFSTHSPHLVMALPDDAIKTFHQLDDGRFGIVQATHPYAAFQRLGGVGGGKIRVVVEDRLAKDVVEQALMTLADPAERAVFEVDYPSGGADSILAYHIPVLIDSPGHTLVLLDGDKRRVSRFPDPDTIPVASDHTLLATIKEAVGLEPKLTVDGGAGGANGVQLASARRAYLRWVLNNLDFIPMSCPEELVLKAAGRESPDAKTSADHKTTLREIALELFGSEVSNEATDQLGISLLAMNRDNSPELSQVAQKLRAYLNASRLKK